MPGTLSGIIGTNIIRMMDFTGDTAEHIYTQINIHIDLYRSGKNDMLITTYQAIMDYFYLRYDQFTLENFHPETAFYVKGGRDNLYFHPSKEINRFKIVYQSETTVPL